LRQDFVWCGPPRRSTPFDLSLGISLAALVAPFSFLGPAGRRGIRRVKRHPCKAENFSTSVTRWSGLAIEGMADSGPCAGLWCAHSYTPELLEEIARGVRKRARARDWHNGHLDSGLPVTWNMCSQSLESSPESLQAFRNIMIASASIPRAVVPRSGSTSRSTAAFFQAMHVTGASHAGLPVSVAPFARARQAPGTPLRRAVYGVTLSATGKLEPEWSETPLPPAERGRSTITHD